jgi:hypothetical protein
MGTSKDIRVTGSLNFKHKYAPDFRASSSGAQAQTSQPQAVAGSGMQLAQIIAFNLSAVTPIILVVGFLYQ